MSISFSSNDFDSTEDPPLNLESDECLQSGRAVVGQTDASAAAQDECQLAPHSRCTAGSREILRQSFDEWV